jgi:hypothetical protein
MATAQVTKFRLPSAKILRFTPTGKAVPVSEQRLADSMFLATYFPGVKFTESERHLLLPVLRKVIADELAN